MNQPQLAHRKLNRLIALAALLLTSAAPAHSDQTPGSSATDDREAIALVQDLLAQLPPKDLVLSGTFRIRRSGNRRSEVPVTYAVRLGGTDWESIYNTQPTSVQGAERLTIVHRGLQPSRYEFSQISLDGSKTNTMNLTGGEAALSFAGTDFWLTDLGLEFLHWPQQRLVRDAKITMRLGRPCRVLESTNPHPAEGFYSRVISWIDSEMGNLIYAEAYDVHNKRLKVFSLHGFRKVNGRWQVKEMVLRNDQADSRTQLDFNFQEE